MRIDGHGLDDARLGRNVIGVIAAIVGVADKTERGGPAARQQPQLGLHVNVWLRRVSRIPTQAERRADNHPFPLLHLNSAVGEVR